MEFLKPLFEDGKAMTYEELANAISLYNQTSDKKNKIKLANLSQGEYVSIHKFHNKLTQLTETKHALNEAKICIETYKHLNQQSMSTSHIDWKIKYDSEMRKLQKQLEDKDYQIAVDQFFHHYTFTSENARRGIQDLFRNQSFTLHNGILLGAEKFMEHIQKEDPAAFKDKGTNCISNISGTPLTLVLKCE